MAIKRIEALADTIAFLNSAHDPSSDAYQLRNPLLARSFTFKHLADTDEKGRRRFSSWIGGYRFAIQDLQWKISGQTRAKGSNGKLGPESTLADLLMAFNFRKPEDLFTAVDFLQRALGDEKICTESELSYFLNEGTENA